MRIYIAGKITGLDLKEAESRFNLAEQEIIEQGDEPVNPFKILPTKEGLTWEDYMKADIRAICDCNAIYMLRDWETSKGATIEFNLANNLGLTVYFQ